MLYWTIQWIIISLILIILLHNLYTFLKNTLTFPKVKDLVTRPTQRYNELLSTIKNDNADFKPTTKLPGENEGMKNELKHFLNELKNSKATSAGGSHTSAGGATSAGGSPTNAIEATNAGGTTNIDDIIIPSNNIQPSNEILAGGTSTDFFSNFNTDK